MKQAPKILSVVVLTQILGCASMLPPSGSINEQIDYWLDRKEYAKALSIVTDLYAYPVPEISNPKLLEDKILEQASRYEQQVIVAAENAAAKDDWRSALDLYQEALARLPDSEKLKEGQQQLIKQQEASLAKLQLDLLIAQGDALHKELLISERVAATDPRDWFAQHELDNKHEEADKLANDLAEYGRRALAQGDLEMAKRTLPLAVKLSSAPDIKTADARLQELLKEEAKRIREEQQRIALDELQQQQEQQKLADKQAKKKQRAIVVQNQVVGGQTLTDFKKACDEGNFTEAQRLRQKLAKLNVDNPEFQELCKNLDNHIASHVQHLTEVGTQHYSRQQYEQALQAWQEAQALDPQNEQLKAHVERASRVIEKLKTLKQKQEPGRDVIAPVLEK